MAEFRGYLLKIGNTIFPNQYIALKSYKSTPNQRGELKAYRNANYDLIRQTSPNYKTKVEFNTIQGLKLEDRRIIKNILDSATTIEKERKIANITYWNDEYLRYETMTCYVPDTEYTIHSISDDDVKYESFRLAFIEY